MSGDLLAEGTQPTTDPADAHAPGKDDGRTPTVKLD